LERVEERRLAGWFSGLSLLDHVGRVVCGFVRCRREEWETRLAAVSVMDENALRVAGRRLVLSAAW